MQTVLLFDHAERTLGLAIACAAGHVARRGRLQWLRGIALGSRWER